MSVAEGMSRELSAATIVSISSASSGPDISRPAATLALAMSLTTCGKPTALVIGLNSQDDRWSHSLASMSIIFRL